MIHDLGVPAPVTALVEQYVSALMAAGRGEEDYSSLARAVFDAAHLE
jgi:3-hydroxyisobutyrate dehydrogenase-like beta-hydroxyacid dehydrogenase